MANPTPTPSDANARTHDVATRVLELVNTRGVHRIQLLELACEILNAERVAALLWLWEDHHYWKGLALSRYFSNVVKDPVPAELRDREASPLPGFGDCPNEASQWALSKRYDQSLATWADKNGFGTGEAILPVTVLDGNARKAIAFMHLLSSARIDASTIANLQIVSGGLALILTLSRDRRRLDSIQNLLREEKSKKRVEDWLALAADKLIEITHAEAAMMFREVPEGYGAIVTRGKSDAKERPIASPDSVVTNIAATPRSVRLRNFADDPEREAIFGTKNHDHVLHTIMERDLLNGPVRSVLLAPVVFEKHVLAVLALVNKKAEVHLARIFSKTDEEVLSNVCGLLAGVLPSIELYEALGEMAKVVSPKTLEDGEERQKVYDVLLKMIPAIEAVALIRKHAGQTEFTIANFGRPLWTADTGVLVSALDKFVAVSGTSHYYKTFKIPETTSQYLAVELKRGTMTDYEDRVLMFFVKALSHILLADEGRRAVTESFAQLRHAVRSGITGVVGYVSEALGCYEQYRLTLNPLVFTQARFHKALERANFSAKRSSHLLEESTFLLKNITRDMLRPSAHGITNVVRGVLLSLKPYGDERRVELAFNNRLKRLVNDVAEFERVLVEMMVFNLVDNAIKYSYRNRRVTVTLSGDSEQWKLSVMDWGTQILPEDLEAIFLPFTRRPTGQGAKQRPGTGLGLPVARQIARAHGGDITCDSVIIADKLAETTFVVTLPRILGGES